MEERMTARLGEMYQYRGRKYLGPDGRIWKVIGVAMLDGRIYLELRRAWHPLSRRLRYAEPRGDGGIAWLARKDVLWGRCR